MRSGQGRRHYAGEDPYVLGFGEHSEGSQQHPSLSAIQARVNLTHDQMIRTSGELTGNHQARTPLRIEPRHALTGQLAEAEPAQGLQRIPALSRTG